MILVAAGVCLGGGIARAQERIEYSAAGPYAAGAFEGASNTQQDYNLKMGPVLFTMDAGVGVGYNSNVNLAEEGQISDGFVQPNVGIGAFWQVTELNSLSLNLGLAYTAYFNTPEADTKSILIDPGSELDWDFYIDDFKVTLFDSFYLQQDPTQQIQLADVINFTRFNNTAGINVLWDLNDLDVEFGYSYTIYRSLQNQFDFVSRDTQAGWLSLTFQLDPGLRAGISSSVGVTNYLNNYLNNNTYFQVGPFVEWQATPYITITGQAGAQIGSFADTGGVDDNSQLASPYGEIGILHRINPFVDSALNFGFTSPMGLTSNFYNLAYVEHELNWRVVKDVALTSVLFYENGHDSGGNLAENINRWGAGINAGYSINEHLEVNLSYRYISRNSNLPLRSYDQNVVFLDFNYDF